MTFQFKNQKNLTFDHSNLTNIVFENMLTFKTSEIPRILQFELFEQPSSTY